MATIQAGERYNVIQPSVKLSGTIRSFASPVQDTIERRMREVFDGITKSAGAAFTADDAAVGIGMRAMTIAVLDYLGGTRR